MSAATTTGNDHLIRPHGGELVDRTGDRPDGVEETVTLTSRELSDLDMLASGALSPLTGFMGRDDYESVLENMRLANGLPWALPVCLAVDEAPRGDRVLLGDNAVLEVEDVYEYAHTEAFWRYLPNMPRPYTRVVAAAFLERATTRDLALQVEWAIEFEGHVIGAINLRPQLADRRAGTGYGIGPRTGAAAS